jgi:hypothetical protein
LLSFPASLARLNLRLYSQEALRLSAWILTLALPTLGRTSTVKLAFAAFRRHL